MTDDLHKASFLPDLLVAALNRHPDRPAVYLGDQVLTAVITRDAVNELKLKRGDEAVAIIKSTEVMIGRSSTDRPAKHSR